jgi:hypothetical protein
VKHTPTDLQVLSAIYDQYHLEFTSFSEGSSTRSAKIYVPIDVKTIAAKLEVDHDIVFGRLYYHLERMYGYEQSDGSKVHLFALAVGSDKHCVNFPYVASVLANLREENKKYRVATTIAIVALFVSTAAIAVSILC